MGKLHPTLAFVLACRNDDGGFGLFPGAPSCLRATYYGLSALALFEMPPADADKTSGFVLRQQNPDGGFRGQGGLWERDSALIHAFHAVQALEALKRPRAVPDKIAAWVHSRQRHDGGYQWDGWLPPEERERSSLESTYYAVETLAVLGEVPADPEAAVAFLRARQSGTQRKDGSFALKVFPNDTETPGSVGLTLFTGMGLAALQSLGSTSGDRDGALRYLRSQQTSQGGFSKGMGQYKAYDDFGICRMSDAYHATRGLKLLGEPAAEPEALSKWVNRCLTTEGGFSRLPEIFPPDLEATFQALSILRGLGRSFPSPARPEPPAEETKVPLLKFPCPQLTGDRPEEVRYLYRITARVGSSLNPRNDLELALALRDAVNAALLFRSNWEHSGAQILIDGFGTCGPQGRAYVALANAAGIESRMVYLEGHGVAESKIDGQWVMIDPMLRDLGRDEAGKLLSAADIRERHVTGKPDLTKFGDWRYKALKVEKPEAVN